MFFCRISDVYCIFKIFFSVFCLSDNEDDENEDEDDEEEIPSVKDVVVSSHSYLSLAN